MLDDTLPAEQRRINPTATAETGKGHESSSDLGSDSPAAAPTSTAPPDARLETPSDPLSSTIDRARQSAKLWLQRSQRDPTQGVGESPWLLAIPDVGPTCEVLLADQLFHDLTDEERRGMLEWIRSQQRDDGSWATLAGRADLSLTALAWWALVAHGEDREAPHMAAALRAVHAMGGAQRGSFMLRLWLAMAGTIDWSWLPAIPSELVLLPSHVPLSLERLSPWARGVVMPYHALAQAPARLHLADPSPLLLKGQGPRPIPPRLTRAGLAGDLLQAFDRSIKMSRKLPRGPLGRWANARRVEWLQNNQQGHGGWFSTRPTLLSCIALRARGARSDDPRVTRALAYLRRARGCVEVDRGRVIAQGLGGRPLGLVARLASAARLDDPRWLLEHELTQRGPWCRRADVEAGGWPMEAGSQLNVDLWATCAGLEHLEGFARDPGPLAAEVWSARRRSAEVIMAMQEHDGGFARFERGECEVPHARLPWVDASQLMVSTPDAEDRIMLSARALRSLQSLGWQGTDDRIQRGIAFLQRNFQRDARAWSTVTLASVCEAAVAHCPAEHALRRGTESLLRSRQLEDGSFGTMLESATALRAIVRCDVTTGRAASGAATRSSSGSKNPNSRAQTRLARNKNGQEGFGPCVQAHRAAEHLAQRARLTSVLESNPATVPGLGLSPLLDDPSAAIRESVIALESFADSLRTPSS